MKPGLLKQPRELQDATAGKEPMAPEEMPDEGPGEDHPAYQAAEEYLGTALYDKKAASDIATALRKAPDLAAAMAETAYEMAAQADEKTRGQIPDELLALLGATCLHEVTQIAQTAGLDVPPRVIGESYKQMVLRLTSEMGLDTEELEGAMNQVDPSYFDQIAQMEAA